MGVRISSEPKVLARAQEMVEFWLRIPKFKNMGDG